MDLIVTDYCPRIMFGFLDRGRIIRVGSIEFFLENNPEQVLYHSNHYLVVGTGFESQGTVQEGHVTATFRSQSNSN